MRSPFSIPGRAVLALVGVVAWWATSVLGDLPPHLSSLAPQGRAIESHSYCEYTKRWKYTGEEEEEGEMYLIMLFLFIPLCLQWLLNDIIGVVFVVIIMAHF